MAGGLWTRKFDYTNGEDRVCRKCNEPFHTKKPSNVCRLCQNKEQKVIQLKLREKVGKKENYPFSTKTNDAGKRFSKIRVELNKVWRTGDRDLIRKHYQKQLEEAERLGIMTWINDVRTNQAIKDKKIKTKNQISIEFPDTRGYYEE